MKKVLIVYYSWSNGNTQRIAKKIQKATCADIARIDTVVPYPDDYNETVNQAQDEVNCKFLPKIKPLGVDVSSYDVIIIGTPTWWYTMAPAVATFLKQTDLSQKTVIPFMTNAGWKGTVISDMARLSNGANVTCSKEIKYDNNGGDILETSQSEIDDWIKEIVAVCEK